MFYPSVRFLPALLFAWLALVGAATAAPIEYKKVKDEAHYFKPETLDKVNALVKEIKEKYGKDFCVETFETARIEHGEKLPNMTPEALKRFFQKWAEERAKINNVDGIYVLVCKKPVSYAYILVWPPDPASPFGDTEKARLEKLLPTRGFFWTRDKRFIEAAQYVDQVLGAPPPAPPSPTPWWLWFTGGLLGLVTVLVILRALSSRPHPQNGGPAVGPESVAAGPRPSGIMTGIGGPIGMAAGHSMGRLPVPPEDDLAGRKTASDGQEGLPETARDQGEPGRDR